MNNLKVMICADLGKELSKKVVSEACIKLNETGIQPLIEKQYKPFLNVDSAVFAESDKIIDECDMFMTIGGDGTILKWGQKAASFDKPLLGINTGRLGFMTSLESNELDLLSRLATGEYSISRRMLLDVEYEDHGTYTVINDVVFNKCRYSKLPEFSVSVEGYEVTNIRADGIIFSTPSGSTAYSLSAGGPIIFPEAKCIEFTPLCAHSLFGRPMIFSSDQELTVSFTAYENSGVSISIDGNDDMDFSEGETIRIRKSDQQLSLIDINGSSFYKAVHNKLMRPLK